MQTNAISNVIKSNLIYLSEKNVKRRHPFIFVQTIFLQFFSKNSKIIKKIVSFLLFL